MKGCWNRLRREEEGVVENLPVAFVAGQEVAVMMAVVGVKESVELMVLIQ